MGIKRSQVETVRQEGAKPSSAQLASTEATTDIKASVDRYNEINEEIKALESQRQVHKDAIENFYKPVYAQSVLDGNTSNFRVATENSKVLFQTQNRSKLIGDERAELFATKFGADASEEIIEINVASIRMCANLANKQKLFTKILKALKDLETTFGCEIIQEGGMKVCADVVAKAAKHADSPEKLAEILEALQITQFIQKIG